MALVSTKVKQMPSDAPGANIFARDENKDFFMSHGQEIEIFHVADDGLAATGTIVTGFEHVQGGWFFNVTDNASSSAIDVKPSATQGTADVSGLPSLAKTYIAILFGFKNPLALT